MKTDQNLEKACPPPSEASKIGGGAQAPQALPPRTGYARDRKKRSGIQIQRKNRF